MEEFRLDMRRSGCRAGEDCDYSLTRMLNPRLYRSSPSSSNPMPKVVLAKPFDWTYTTTYNGHISSSGTTSASEVSECLVEGKYEPKIRRSRGIVTHCPRPMPIISSYRQILRIRAIESQSRNFLALIPFCTTPRFHFSKMNYTITALPHI